MPYIPEQGDIIILDFNPQSGHEQKGNRPALVVSNNIFNRRTRIAVVCPITNTERGFPLHVSLDNRTSTTGVVMCEQVKSLDITARNAVFKEKAPLDVVEEVTDVIVGFFEAHPE
ncbi:MAG: type II toxin-antitoxin system PemK/MazF family toxin [Nitrospiraceae bacterium]|nr:MAG: type II toxin-antitoxin system PemK/MazF family toxin [Nitrospiraceae bacterium]